LAVWEQAGAVASDKPEHNTHIGEGWLKQLPPGPAGTPFEVVFHMTEMGLLQVHAREETSGSEVRFEIQIGGLDETEVMRATEMVAGYEVSG
jgi:molecular chaperone DnaK